MARRVVQRWWWWIVSSCGERIVNIEMVQSDFLGLHGRDKIAGTATQRPLLFTISFL